MYKQQDLNPVLAHNLRDEILMQCVAIANEGAILPVTLVLDGQIVFGNLISGSTYCYELSKSLDLDQPSNHLLEKIKDYVSVIKEKNYNDLNHQDNQPFYLHLENYSFLGGDGQEVKTYGSLLRVSIQKVSAFSLGRPASREGK